MSKSKTYLLVLLVLAITVLIGYAANIQQIKVIYESSLAYASKPMLSVTAAVCAFLFYGYNNYWFTIAIAALVTSFIIQFLVISSGLVWFSIIVRALTFVIIVFLMNLVKLLVNKVLE